MNMILGRYVPYNTIIHRLDPRIKIVGLVALLVCIFQPFNWVCYAFLVAVILTLLLISRVRISSVFKSLKPMWFMLVLILILNVILIRDGAVLFTIFNYPIYTQSLLQTLQIAIRLTLMIAITTMLTSTTKTLDLTYAIEFYLSPLKVIKFPAHEIAMTISIALRFIPTLLEETEKIMKAQASRGVDLQGGSIKEKITGIIALIIPLFVSSFQRSEELANAMEARGYNPSGKRTRYRVLKIETKDIVGLVIIALITAATFVILNVVVI